MPEPFFAFPIATIRPRPGIEPGDVEMPGPGLYELTYKIPAWVRDVLNGLGAGELDVNREFTLPFVNGMEAEHLRTQWEGTTVRVRLRLVESELKPAGPEIQSNVASVGRLTLQVFNSPSFRLLVTFGIASALVKGLESVTKFAEFSGGQALLIGGGVALAGLGVAKFKG